MSLSLAFTHRMSEQAHVRPMIPMPMVYEDAPVTPTSWEYHVLTIDAREAALPDGAQLNELGNQGWLLAGILEQKTGSGTPVIHYYFVRQKMA